MVKGGCEGYVDSGEVSSPEKAACFLLYGEDLSFCGVRVHSALAADREVLDGSFESSDPVHFEGWFDALVVLICVGEISETGEPVVLGGG